jgi:thiamine biosynthesis lipoprotein
MLRHPFPAMGTDVELLVEAAHESAGRRALLDAESEVRRLERLLSRFLPDSELSRLNRERALDAGDDLLRVVELALSARRRTSGRVDPTVHDAVVAAGYDRSFDALPKDSPAAVRPAARCGGEVRIDRRRGRIELAPGVRLDLGGIAKGYAAERACDIMAPAGPCLANIGGDIAIRGLLSTGGWPIGVETPEGDLTLALASGGLATSGRDRRRWRRGGRELHHLIDPATGRPTETDLERVTVVAADAVEAEALAKSLLLAGCEQALAEAKAAQTPCVLISEIGAVHLGGGLR